MKVLIDGSVFTQQISSEIREFWTALIPQLVQQQQTHEFYYLNRNTQADFTGIDGLKILFAPPPDLAYSAIENQRLQLLCQELGVTGFISTSITSAGRQVKSIFIATTPADVRNTEHFSAYQRAVRFSSYYVALSPALAEDLERVFKVAREEITLIDGVKGEIEEITTLLNQLAEYTPSSEKVARQLAEEEATQSEIEMFRPNVYGGPKTRTTQILPPSALITSEINQLIPPEIINDEFYIAIRKIAETENIKTVLEIGSSSGEGSTRAFVEGLKRNPERPALYCMEIVKPRFDELQRRYQNDSFVKAYCASSVATKDIPSEVEVIDFYTKNETALNLYPLDLVLSWLRQGNEYLKTSAVPENGIRKIKQDHNINAFDVVLIDGSEFTGHLELDEVYGAKYILLDDINTFKNYWSHRRLLADPNYTLIAENLALRNGYSIFKRNTELPTNFDLNLPIHFFTIVLNGEPFIRYHINVLKQLPFQWHWHIVEGVADLQHDTAWSLQLGGKITDALHRNGYSKDGTTEYLDELAKQYPDNITIYRKPPGVFWDGKREMVNAPLANIKEECLLWQIDVDELWTFQQICEARKQFIKSPERTAAFYWCWYFVGENLVISTRNCYTQNPQQDWLRTWRYKPGYVWAAHEPPILVEALPDGQYKNVAAVNPFLHDEMEKVGLVFQHFAYITVEQLSFKEDYYGYRDAVLQWTKLQSETQFPALLKNYFAWVQDETEVNTVAALNISPLLVRDLENNSWKFVQTVQKKMDQTFGTSPRIVIDGVFFQLYQTGIARVWRSLLEVWAEIGFSSHIIVLDRTNSTPKIAGIQYRQIPAYDYANADADREMLQQICDEEGADLFISTYYSTPVSTPSAFLAYDMIPEVMGWNLNEPMWQEKHRAISQASKFLSISASTARDLAKFFPAIDESSVTVAYCGVSDTFKSASEVEIKEFKFKYGITKPYFLLVGTGGYKNTDLFLQAFTQLPSKTGFDIVFTAQGVLSEEVRAYTAGSTVHLLRLSDEELRLAYAGAVALVYPSKYEGFGLPVLEALACGCPVITCPNASIPEVAGQAAIYVKDNDVNELANALCDVQKPGIRNALVTAGLRQAQQFSWENMAQVMSSALLETNLPELNLRAVNLVVFPNWQQDEETVYSQLLMALKVLIEHPEKRDITLLIDTQGIDEEVANEVLSAVTMELFFEVDLEGEEIPEIALLGKLNKPQWQVLKKYLKGRLIMEAEDEKSVIYAQVKDVPSLTLQSFGQIRFL